MKSVKFINEKGNVSNKVRNAVRAQIDAKLSTMLAEQFEEVQPNANGGYAIPVAQDEKTGDIIYATVSFSLSLKNPAEKTERKKVAKVATAEEVEVPDLF